MEAKEAVKEKAVKEEAAAEEAGGATCNVEEAGTAAKLQAALDANAAARTPVLLRNAARAWPVHARGLLWKQLHQPAMDALIPVSTLWEDGDTNRMLPLTSLPPLPADVEAHLHARNVSRAVLRAPRRFMRWADAQALLRGQRCSRCYIKQVRLDMHLPEILRGLHPPRLSQQPLGDAFLWVNGGNATTGLHTDERDNMLVLLAGAKVVLALPPSMGSALGNVPLLDVATDAPVSSTRMDRLDRGVVMGVAEEAGVDGIAVHPTPRLPQTIEQVHLANTRYLAPHDAVWAALQKASAANSAANSAGHSAADLPVGSFGCRFTVQAPDALYLPAGTIHAVDSRPAGAPVAAVSFFYGPKQT